MFWTKRNFNSTALLLLTVLSIYNPHCTIVNGFSSPSSKANIRTFHMGAGCFWAPADQLRNEPGIISTTVGYCGDDETSLNAPPSYETVCSGRTKLVEAVRVEYDTSQLSYADMLALFAKVNTAENGYKRQYQGIIFTQNEEEAAFAQNFVEEDKSVIATVEPMSNTFYTAEGYHQDYWLKWKLRLPIFILLIASVSYFGEDLGRELCQKLWNGICYGAIGFTLLERRFDTKKEKIIVGQLD